MKKQRFATILQKSSNIYTLKTIAIIPINTEVQPIAQVIENIVCLKKFLCFFHNGLSYDYHFIEKDLPKEFEEEFNCLEKKY